MSTKSGGGEPGEMKSSVLSTEEHRVVQDDREGCQWERATS